MARIDRNRNRSSLTLSAAILIAAASSAALAGGIAPVEKYRASQITAGDVVLADRDAERGAAPSADGHDLRARVEASGTELASDVQDGATFQDAGDRLGRQVINLYVEDPAHQMQLRSSDAQDGATFQDAGDRLSRQVINLYVEDPAHQMQLHSSDLDGQGGNLLQGRKGMLGPAVVNVYVDGTGTMKVR